MNRRIISAIVIVLVLGIGGFFIFSRLRAGPDAAGVFQYKVTKVTVGQVKKTVASSGILQPWNVIDIKARAGGELTLLAVDVGDEIKKGQLLARIDPLDVQLSLSTARADEQSAVARKTQSSESYKLQVAQSQIAIRDAEASLRSAIANAAASRSRLATIKTQSGAQPELTRTAVANAQASYEQAQKQLQQLQITNKQQRASATASYEQALANQKNARQVVDRQKALVEKGFVSQQAVDTAEANAAVIDATAQSAKIKLDTVEAELSTGIEASEARVRQTKAALDQAKANTIDIQASKNSVQESEAAVKQAEAQVNRARVALDQAKANVANNQIKGMDVTVAEATIARARASRINAETTLQRTEIRAPSDAVVLQKYVEQGTIIASALSIAATGTNILQIGDTSRMYVDVSVDETDIASVDVGQSVEVAIEAYPGVPYEGKVIRVDPRAQVEQNVTTIHVRVEVDNSSPTFRLLKPGMNANCEFVVSDKEGVVKVPNEAIREDDQGKFVETAEGGKPAPPDPKTGTPAEEGAIIDIKKQRVGVEVGIVGNEETEVTTGLKDGDTVITQTIEPAPTTSTSPFSTFGRSTGGGGGRSGGGGGAGRR